MEDYRNCNTGFSLQSFKVNDGSSQTSGNWEELQSTNNELEGRTDDNKDILEKQSTLGHQQSMIDDKKIRRNLGWRIINPSDIDEIIDISNHLLIKSFPWKLSRRQQQLGLHRWQRDNVSELLRYDRKIHTKKKRPKETYQSEINNRYEIVCYLSQSAVFNLNNLCQSISVALLSELRREDLASMNSSIQQGTNELGQMLRESFRCLTVMLDILLLSILQYSTINTIDSVPKQRRDNLHFILRTIKKLGQTKPGGSPRRQSNMRSAVIPKESKHRTITDPYISHRRTKGKENMIMNGYRYPQLIPLIESIMINGSGLGVTSDGIWNAGLLLRLSVIQMLNSCYQFAISSITQSIFISEGLGHTCQSRLLRNCVQEKSNDEIGTDNQLSLEFSEDLIFDLDPSLAFLYLLKTKLLINQMRDWPSAARCCLEWIEKQDRSSTHQISSNHQIFDCRIRHLLGVAYLGHASMFLINSPRRKHLTQLALDQFNESLSFDPNSFSSLYFQSLCMIYMDHIDASIDACHSSIRLFPGYPASWVLLAGLSAIKSHHDSCPLLSAIHILQLGILHCGNHPVLFLVLLDSIIKSSSAYNPFRYLVDPLLSFSSHSYSSVSSQSFLNLILDCIECDPPPNNPPINDYKQHSDITTLINGLTLFDRLVCGILRLPPSDMSYTSNHQNEQDTNHQFILDSLYKIDLASDLQLLNGLGHPNVITKKKTMDSNIPVVESPNELMNATLWNEISFGGLIRSQLDKSLDHYSGINWQGLPIPSYSDVQQVINDDNMNLLIPVEPCSSLDRLRIHIVMIIMADLLCDVGQLDLAQEVLSRVHRLLHLFTRHQITGSYDNFLYETSVLHLEFCRVMSRTSHRFPIHTLTDLNKRLTAQSLIRPFCSRSLTLRAAVLTALSDYSTSLELLRKSLIIDSNNLVTLRLLIVVQFKLGLKDELMKTAFTLNDVESKQRLVSFDWLPIEVL